VEPLTVILPVHNGGNYLGEAISSVLVQDHEAFVLRVLDDDSEDDSAEIVRSFRDKRVMYSKNKVRSGLFRTLNRGFEEATTRWVKIWAHDDRMVPGALGRFACYASEFPEAGMIYSDFLEMDAHGRRTGDEQVHRPQRVRTPDIAPPRISALLFLSFGCLPGNISTVMLRRDVWGELRGFLEVFQQAPDYDMWVRVSEVYPVAFIREPQIELRSHELQLGRLGQKNMASIAEEHQVLIQLIKRLEGIASPNEINGFWRTHRGAQHMHWIVKALIRGDMPAAKAGWESLKLYGPRYAQFIAWLFTANGHVFAGSRAKFFDKGLLALRKLEV